MSWVYLPAPAEDCLPPGCLVGTQSASSRLSRTVNASSHSDSATDTSSRSRSGPTCARSTVDRGVDESTSLAAGSHARTSVLRVRVRDLQAIAADSGLKCSESLARYGLRMCSPKTVRTCAPADWMSSSAGLPAWGMTSLGVCWALGTSVRLTAATGCGSSALLPTPTGAGNEGSPSMQKWPAHRALGALMATPTASGSDARNTNRPSARATRAMLPTPTATLYGSNQGGASGRTGPKRLSLESRTGGVFIALREWLMGWPIGWSASEPLATDRFRPWLRSHGASCPTSSAAPVAKPEAKRLRTLVHSPSSISTANQCRRKWWLRYREGIKPPEFTWSQVVAWDAWCALAPALKRKAKRPPEPVGGQRSTALGKEVHARAEVYLTAAPKSPAARRLEWNDLPGLCLAELIPLLPPAGSLRRSQVERHVTLRVGESADAVSFRGVIDVASSVGAGAARLLESWDHKTSGNITDYALLPPMLAERLVTRWYARVPDAAKRLLAPPSRSLRDDLQACFYVLARAAKVPPAAAHGGLARWNYTETKQTRRSLPVVAYVPTEHARTVVERAATVAREVAALTSIDSAVPNTLACDEYGGCWYRIEGHCTVPRKLGAVLAHTAAKETEYQAMKSDKPRKFADLENDTAAANEAEERAARKAARKAKAAAEAESEDDADADADAPESEPESAPKAKRKPAPVVEDDSDSDDSEDDADDAPESEPAPVKAKPRAVPPPPKSPRAAAQAKFDRAVPRTAHEDVESARGALQLAFGKFCTALSKAVEK